MAAGHVCLPHLLHLRKVVQQADSVLGVGLVVLAARRSNPQRPRGHGLQHCFIQLLGDQRVGQLSQVVLQHSWKREYTESEINSCRRIVSGCWLRLSLRSSLQHHWGSGCFPTLELINTYSPPTQPDKSPTIYLYAGVPFRYNKLLFSLSFKRLKLANALGCKLCSHCFRGWSRGVCGDAWLESGVTRQPKVSGGPGVCDGPFTPVTSASRGSDKSYRGKHETRAVCLH